MTIIALMLLLFLIETILMHFIRKCRATRRDNDGELGFRINTWRLLMRRQQENKGQDETGG